jgi:hypothetical protein
MTEDEWLACATPDKMLEFLDGIDVLTDRKQRLLDCACVRRLWHLLTDEDGRRAVEVAERYADDLVDIVDLREVQGLVLAARDAQVSRNILALNHGEPPASPPSATDSVCVLSAAAGVAWEYRSGADPLWYAAQALMGTEVGTGSAVYRARLVAEHAFQAALVREVFGNPFRPADFDSDWRTETVLLLARQMYESGEFDAMPILADALQDAGCHNEDILSHCRGPGPHVRGCWVVDLILGKE